MDVYRIWYCRCTGKPVELSYEDPMVEVEEVREEPVCRLCGASPSSDPRKTISFRDVEDWKV